MRVFIQRHRKSALIGLWLASQAGAALGIAVNWETTAIYIALAVFYVALNGLIVGLIATVGPDRLQRRLQNLVIPARWLIPLAGGLLILWAIPLKPAYPFDALRWLLTVAGAGMIAVLLRDTSPRGVWKWGFLALLVLMVLFSLATVMIYPRIYTDEGWNLNKIWSSAAQGPVYDARILLGVLGTPHRIDAPIVYWPVGLLLKVAGLGLWQGRLAFWLFMPLAVALIYRAGYLLFNSRYAGRLAALLLAGSVPVLYTAHFIRPEIVLIAVFALGLYLHARAEKRQRFLEPYIMGLLLSLSMAIHTNSFVLCVAFGGLYLGRAIKRCWDEHRLLVDARLLGLVAGGITGAIIFAVVYILPDTTTFLEQMQYSYRLNYNPPPDITFWEIALTRLSTTVNHLRSWFALSLVEASMIMLAVVVTTIRGGSALRSLLTLLLWGLIGFLVLGGRRAPTYIAILAPLGVLIVAGTLTQMLREPGRMVSLGIGMLLVAATWGISIRQVVIAQQESYNRDVMSCLTALSEHLPDDGMILGEHLFWLARPEPTGYAARTLVETPWPGRDRDGWWEWIDPDIVLWPGPIYGPHFRYVQTHDYYPVEIAKCPPTLLNIWLKPGIEISGAKRAS